MENESRRNFRLDQAHATAQLVEAFRTAEPDYNELERWLEEHPELHNAVIAQANLLHSGSTRNQISRARHAAVFLGLNRLRRIVAQHLKLHLNDLQPRSAREVELELAPRPLIVGDRLSDSLPFL